MSRPELARYRPEHLQQVVRMLGNPAVRARLWAWQFESNPRGIPFDPVVATDGDRVVGFNGVMPVRIRFDGADRLACWSCDFNVDAGYRGGGVGRILKDELHARHPLLLTFGVSEIAVQVLSHMGWRRNGDVAEYRRIQRASSHRDRALQLIQTGNRLRYLLTDWPAGSLVVETRDTLPEAAELDALWQRVAPGYQRIVCRDHAYLDWRYGRFPGDGYRFLCVRRQDRLEGLLVHREYADRSRLVDLIAAAGDHGSRAMLVHAWLQSSRGCRLQQVVCADAATHEVLEAAGFMRTRSRPGFFVHDGAPTGGCERDWVIYAGDSDGEFLQSGQELRLGSDPACPPPAATAPAAEAAPDLVVRRLSALESFGRPDAWQALLDRSEADPLFMSWPWQSAWWDTWGESLGLELLMLGVYRGETLVGLAPMFLHRHVALGRPQTDLHFIGNAWHIAPTVRTEYVSIIADREVATAVREALHDALGRRIDWDLLVVCDHVTGAGRPPIAAPRRVSVITRRVDHGIAIDTSGAFDDWLAALGKNTRLKIYNRRRYLAGRAAVDVSDDPDHGAALERMNALHFSRWAAPCFEADALAFHHRLLERLTPGMTCQLSNLSIDGVVRSILYDMQVGARTYNLQAGFEEDFDRKVSLGTLHLGYAIERAFEDPAVNAYDLLAGSGKNTFYKQHFNGHEVEFLTFQLVRRPHLRLLFRAYQQLPGGIRSLARSWVE